MYILLYRSNKPEGMPDHTFIPIDLQSLYLREDLSSYLYITNIEEFLADHIANSLDRPEYKDIKAVIIDKDLKGDGWSRAIRLAGHIATTPYSNCQLNKLPILLTDRSHPDMKDSSLTATFIGNPFHTGGFHFKTHKELFTQEEDPISGNIMFSFEREQLAKVDHHKLQINGSEDNRHQSTNEWGAMRLAYNFGLGNQVTFNYPKHLYFKYLALSLEDGNIQQDESLSGLFNKVLLIDDHAGQGWKELMEKIFVCQVDSLIPSPTDLGWQAKNFEQYDLVLLDLYLEGRPDKTLSMAVLKFIKDRHPNIPVVIFTASEKAWNLDEVMDNGADGMYIKESPVYFKDEQYSLENYNDFKRTIASVHKKYQVLRPYWKVIDTILSNRNFVAIENGTRKMKDRLAERLKMFYGLLKKGYEQSNYDIRTFFYSDHELAFMTLWSTLNEIQAYRFQKTQGPNTEWKLLSDGSYYIKYQASRGHSRRLPAQFHSALRAKPGWFAGASADTQKFRFEQQIRLQISFIIERMAPSNKAAILADLLRLNHTRNALYLTHGEDNSNFFSSTEAGKRLSTITMTPRTDIKDLFNIVSYLLTEDETCKVSII